MRLWHYKLIEYLPNSQLVAQWRELNSIFKKQDKHILINYIYEYSKEDLYVYSDLVIAEMLERGYKVNMNNYYNYFGKFDIIYLADYKPFSDHHNDRYLRQCFYNLQEKYDRGQKDFNEERYNALYDFIIKDLEKAAEEMLEEEGE